MKRRPGRGVPAALAALVLLVAGALTAVVAIQLLLDEPPLVSYDRVATELNGMTWRDTAVLVAGIVAATLGLLALLAAVVPGALTVLPLRADRSGVDSGAARRGVRDTLRDAAASVDGVSHVALRLGRRKVSASARTGRTSTAGLDEAVGDAVRHRIGQIGPATDLTVHTRVRSTRSAR